MYIVVIKVLINLFILIMLFWMIFWDSEPNNPIKRWWIPKVLPAFIWLGLTHEWKMFSPDPYFYTVWPRIKMTLQNGEFIVWEATKSSELGILEKIRYKKFHKFHAEVARKKAAFHTKIDFIEYLLNKYELKNSCAKVEIFMVRERIPVFGKQLMEETPLFQQLIYTYYPAK